MAPGAWKKVREVIIMMCVFGFVCTCACVPGKDSCVCVCNKNNNTITKAPGETSGAFPPPPMRIPASISWQIKMAQMQRAVVTEALLTLALFGRCAPCQSNSALCDPYSNQMVALYAGVFNLTAHQIHIFWILSLTAQIMVKHSPTYPDDDIYKRRNGVIIRRLKRLQNSRMMFRLWSQPCATTLGLVESLNQSC